MCVIASLSIVLSLAWETFLPAPEAPRQVGWFKFGGVSCLVSVLIAP